MKGKGVCVPVEVECGCPLVNSHNSPTVKIVVDVVNVSCASCLRKLGGLAAWRGARARWRERSRV